MGFKVLGGKEEGMGGKYVKERRKVWEGRE